MDDALLSLRGLTKIYPGVIANDDVSFDIGRGEIHALLGENGAGKSTLVKMIYGLVAPDKGEMQLDGARYAPAKPSEARRAGIAMVFQHFSLFDALSVAENVALGMETPPPMSDLARQIREVSETYGLPLDPGRTVGTLSAGERQRVEIIRCLLQNPRLLIMDEPTSVLTPQEVDILFETLRKLKAEGTSILYISHKLEEIRALCDNATILRLGKKVDTCIPSQSSARQMAEMMVGSSFATPEARGGTAGEVLLAVRDLQLPAPGAFGTPCAASALRSAPVRCWALAASRATVRTNCCRPCLANAPPRRAASCWTARTSAAPVRWRGAGWGCCPAPRNGWAMPPPRI